MLKSAKKKMQHYILAIIYTYYQLLFFPKHRINSNQNNKNRNAEDQVITKAGSHGPSIIYTLHHRVFLNRMNHLTDH